MNKKKLLVKNTFIILIGKICTQFLSFFLMPLYTNILSSKQYGTFDLIITYISLCIPIITMQLDMGVFRELIDVRDNQLEKNRIITSGFISILFQLSIFLSLFFLINFFVKIPYFIYIVFCTVFTAISSYFLQISRGYGDNTDYSIASVIAGVSTLTFNIFFLVILKFGIDGMLLSMGLGNLLACIFLFFKCKIYKSINLNFYDKQKHKALLKYSLPLVPNSLIWWIINVSDRTIITLFLGTATNGIYAVSNKFSNVLIQIFNVFNLSWTESASLHINDNDKDVYFSDIFNTVIKIFSSICILLILVLPIIFELLIGKDYSEAYIYIPLLLIGMIFNIIVSFIGSIYVSLKLTKKVAMTSLYSGIINIVINLILVKYIGIYAAIISTILAFMTMSIYRYLDVQKYVKIKLCLKPTLVIVCLFSTSLIIYYLKYNMLTIILSIILILSMIILNMDLIDIIKSKIVKKKKGNYSCE